jgi:predicted nucleotidyltransferase
MERRPCRRFIMEIGMLSVNFLRDDAVRPIGAISFGEAAIIVRNYIESSDAGPRCVAIFGSVARGQNKPNSDIDVLIISASPRLIKRNLLYSGHRIQTVEGSEDAFRKRIREIVKSRNSFAADIITESRMVLGDNNILSRLQSAASAILDAGAAPITYDNYLSIRCRCADAVEKLATIDDPNHRMMVALRAFALLHELAVATHETWPSVGSSGYLQFVKLAPGFAERLASDLRQAISLDEYDSYVTAIKDFFDITGGLIWSTDRPLPV